MADAFDYLMTSMGYTIDQEREALAALAAYFAANPGEGAQEIPTHHQMQLPVHQAVVHAMPTQSQPAPAQSAKAQALQFHVTAPTGSREQSQKKQPIRAVATPSARPGRAAFPAGATVATSFKPVAAPSGATAHTQAVFDRNVAQQAAGTQSGEVAQTQQPLPQVAASGDSSGGGGSATYNIAPDASGATPDTSGATPDQQNMTPATPNNTMTIVIVAAALIAGYLIFTRKAADHG